MSHIIGEVASWKNEPFKTHPPSRAHLLMHYAVTMIRLLRVFLFDQIKLGIHDMCVYYVNHSQVFHLSRF